MCLAYIIERLNNTEGEGFKVFASDEDGLHPVLFSPDHAIHRGYWMKADFFRPYPHQHEDTITADRTSPHGQNYPNGWHLFETEGAACSWRGEDNECDDVVLKVRYRGARTRGRQDGHHVVVADEIYILTEDELKAGGGA